MKDLIERQDAIDGILAFMPVELKKGASMAEQVNYSAWKTAILCVESYVRTLPSAQPKIGKWIYHIDDLFPAESTMECNQCHAEQPLTCDDEFCPHCGAKMEVTE